MYLGFNVKYLLFLPNFNQTWTFLTDFWKTLKYQMSWKSIHWEPSCSMWMGGQTGRNDAGNSCFLQFCKHMPKNKSFKQCFKWCPQSSHTLHKQNSVDPLVSVPVKFLSLLNPLTFSNPLSKECSKRLHPHPHKKS